MTMTSITLIWMRLSMTLCADLHPHRLPSGGMDLAEVEGTLSMLFERQYILTEEVVVETRYRTETSTDPETGETTSEQVPYDYYICYVTLENFDLSHLPVYIMGEEQVSLYAVYMATLGNRPDLFEGNPNASNSGSLEFTDYDIPRRPGG